MVEKSTHSQVGCVPRLTVSEPSCHLSLECVTQRIWLNTSLCSVIGQLKVRVTCGVRLELSAAPKCRPGTIHNVDNGDVSNARRGRLQTVGGINTSTPFDYMLRNTLWPSFRVIKQLDNLRQPCVSVCLPSYTFTTRAFINHTSRYSQLVRPTMSSGGKRIVFTGGSGKAGRHVIPELLKRGHKVGIDLRW
jgi:hypothetical protein